MSFNVEAKKKKAVSEPLITDRAKARWHAYSSTRPLLIAANWNYFISIVE